MREREREKKNLIIQKLKFVGKEKGDWTRVKCDARTACAHSPCASINGVNRKKRGRSIDTGTQ